MNRRVIALCRTLLTASIALFAPLSLPAEPVPDDLVGSHWRQLLAWHCEFGCGMPFKGGEDMSRAGSGFTCIEDAMRPVPALRGIALAESQREKVLMISHSQAPRLLQTIKAARRAHEGLRHLALSAQFDEARAISLSDSYARSMGVLELLRVKGAHEVYALFTEEQRRQIRDIQLPFAWE